MVRRDGLPKAGRRSGTEPPSETSLPEDSQKQNQSWFGRLADSITTQNKRLSQIRTGSRTNPDLNVAGDEGYRAQSGSGYNSSSILTDVIARGASLVSRSVSGAKSMLTKMSRKSSSRRGSV